MSTDTTIAWTDKSWNPIRGCARVSTGCEHCYAERVAHRFSGKGQPYEGLTRMTDRGPIWTGKIRLVESELEAPLRWKKPSRVFVNSMSDLFHESVPDEFIGGVFAVMALTPRHTYQILTKRPERMREFVADVSNDWDKQWGEAGSFDEDAKIGVIRGDDSIPSWPLSNVWLGVSVEDQKTADERIPLLLQTPAAVRFLSVEPLLERVDLSEWLEGFQPLAPDLSRNRSPIDWVIVGGESGPRARPCRLDWLRSIVRQCQAADVRLFVKQWGAFPTGYPWHPNVKYPGVRDPKGGDPAEWPEDLRVREFPR